VKGEKVNEPVEYKYFSVNPQPRKPGRKTREYFIVNKSQGVRLAVIKWYGAWRQYCFFPSPDAETVWNAGCLTDVQDFLKRLKEEKPR